MSRQRGFSSHPVPCVAAWRVLLLPAVLVTDAFLLPCLFAFPLQMLLLEGMKDDDVRGDAPG